MFLLWQALDSKKYKSVQKVLGDPSSLSLESSLVLSGEWIVCAWQTTWLEDSKNPGRPKGREVKLQPRQQKALKPWEDGRMYTGHKQSWRVPQRQEHSKV